MHTDTLIETLRADARRRPPLQPAPWKLIGLLAVAATAILFAVTLGPRPDFMAAMETGRFLLKFVLTGAAAMVAFGAIRALARPGSSAGRWLRLLAAPVALLALAVVVELAAVPAPLWWERLVGTNSVVCLVAIPLLGIVPLGLFLWAVRRGATTRPLLAGALCGFAAAGIAGFFYAAQCTDDSPLFVATWYPLASGILMALGAIVGSRILRW